MTELGSYSDSSELNRLHVEYLDRLSARAPTVGRIVIVEKGHFIGIEARVIWHGHDRYSTAHRLVSCPYANDRLQAGGTRGFRVQLQPLDGSPAFFISAESVALRDAQVPA